MKITRRQLKRIIREELSLLTEGETYTPGDKLSFANAFRDARDADVDEFLWQGKRFHTRTVQDECEGDADPTDPDDPWESQSLQNLDRLFKCAIYEIDEDLKGSDKK